MKLPLKIFILIIVVAMITVFITASVSYYTSLLFFRHVIAEKLTTVCRIVARDIEPKFIISDYKEPTFRYIQEKLFKYLKNIERLIDTRRIVILSKNRKIIIDTEQLFSQKNSLPIIDQEKYEFYKALNGEFLSTTLYKRRDGIYYISAYGPLKNRNGNIIAVLRITASENQIILLTNLREQFILLSIITILLIAGIGFFISMSMTKPIRMLVSTVEDVSRGNLSKKALVVSKDEIGYLTMRINEMLDGLVQKIKLSERLSNIGELYMGITHEVRNSLNSILTITQILKRGINTAKEKDYLQRIIDEISFTGNFITEFLNYARPSPPDKKLIDDIKSLILDVIKKMEYRFERQVKLSFSGKFHPILADYNQLNQVFTNIIQNGFQIEEVNKFSFYFKYDKVMNILRIEISNNGKLVPDQDLEKIFKPFYTNRKNGTGLGLAMCKKIIDDHSGNIYAENRKSRTYFIIELPVFEDMILDMKLNIKLSRKIRQYYEKIKRGKDERTSNSG